MVAGAKLRMERTPARSNAPPPAPPHRGGDDPDGDAKPDGILLELVDVADPEPIYPPPDLLAVGVVQPGDQETLGEPAVIGQGGTEVARPR